MPVPEIGHLQKIYTIVSAGQVIIIDEVADKLYDTCTGINIVIGDDAAKFSTFTLEINNEEVFPEHWEVLRIKFREQVPFGNDYQELNHPAGGSSVKAKYTDVGPANTYPYLVSIVIKLENKHTK